LASATPSGSWPGGTQAYSYTPLQQMKTDSTGPFAYDGANNPTGLTGTSQQFDQAGQLCWTSATPSAAACNSPPSGATGYMFNTDGQRTGTTPASGTASTYSYNQAGQLTSASTPSGSGTYTYNGDGLRTSKTVSGVVRPFTWGAVDGQNVLLTDNTTDYLYGPGGVPLEQVTGSTASFYVHDQLGSTTLLTTTTGSITGTYAYDTFGKVATHTGTSTPLGYAGGYDDGETGLLYLQNRYYDPATGEFLTIDPALATTAQPYQYAGDDPLNAIDPLGLCWPSWACGAEHAVGHAVQTADNWVHQNQSSLGWAEVGLGVLSLVSPIGWVADAAFLAGTALSVATTADSCSHSEWASCAIGAASIGYGAGSYGVARSANNMARDAEGLGFARRALLRGASKVVRGYAYLLSGTSTILSGISELPESDLYRQACGA
jgi:RHS repeat-associated protein